MQNSGDFERRIERIDALVAELDNADDLKLRDSARELVRTIMDLHGAGLERLLAILDGSGGGAGIIDQMGRDGLVSSLLLLYGLHPVDLRTRLERALEKTRPYLRSHGGNVELLDAHESGTVRLRMEGSCHGCPSSAVTLKLAIEEAIREAAPDVTSIIVEGQVETKPSPGFPLVSLSYNGAHARADGDRDFAWEAVENLDVLPAGSTTTIFVAGQDVLFCRRGETFYAYGNRCPACSRELADGEFADTILTCAGCGERFDVVNAGAGITRADIHLEPYPLLVEAGRARVAVPLGRLENPTAR